MENRLYQKDGILSFQFKDKHSPIYKASKILMMDSKDQATVLDVGCNSGYLGLKVMSKKKAFIFDGIEFNVDAARIALDKSGYRKMYNVDLTGQSASLQEQYDFVVLLDVLEHLPEPDLVLRKLVEHNLAAGGRVIISLPNIARFEYRLMHLLGSWDYEESGIMHRDHLRFFTKKTMIALCEQTGLKVLQALPTGLGSKTGILETLTAFQFLLLCSKA